VQRVRAKAQAAGNLSSNDRQTVTTQGDTIIIQPTNPQVIYVPQYDPVAIFAPPPVWGYYPAGYGVLSFGAGFSAGFFAGYACDWGGWGGGYSHITINNNYYRNTNIHVHDTNVNGNVSRWTPPSSVGRIRRGDTRGSFGGEQRTLGSDDRLGGQGFGDRGRRGDGGGFGGGLPGLIVRVADRIQDRVIRCVRSGAEATQLNTRPRLHHAVNDARARGELGALHRPEAAGVDALRRQRRRAAADEIADRIQGGDPGLRRNRGR
jgi:hypothetical protein